MLNMWLVVREKYTLNISAFYDFMMSFRVFEFACLFLALTLFHMRLCFSLYSFFFVCLSLITSVIEDNPERSSEEIKSEYVGGPALRLVP